MQLPARIFGGRHIYIESNVFIWYGSRIEALNGRPGAARITIGRDTVIQPYVHIGAVDSVSIGKGVLVASGVYVTDHDHSFHDINRPPISNRQLIAAPVVIGDYSWLGERAMVLKGVEIGEHCVIGAGAIVTKSIPSYCVAVGVPARVVRRYSIEDKRWVSVEPLPQ